MSRIHRLIPAPADRARPPRRAAALWPLPLLLVAGLCSLALAPACDAPPEDERAAALEAGEAPQWINEDGEVVALPEGAHVQFVHASASHDGVPGEHEPHVIVLKHDELQEGDHAALLDGLHAAHADGEPGKFMAFLSEDGELTQLDGDAAAHVQAIHSLDDLDGLEALEGVDAETLAKIKQIAAQAKEGAQGGNVWVSKDDAGEGPGHGVFVIRRAPEDE